MEGVNTIVLTLMGASSAAVTQDTSWVKMDQIAVVRAHGLTNHFTWWHSYSCKFCSCHHTYIPNSAHVKSRLWIVATQLEVRNEKCHSQLSAIRHMNILANDGHHSSLGLVLLPEFVLWLTLLGSRGSILWHSEWFKLYYCPYILQWCRKQIWSVNRGHAVPQKA